MSETPNSRDQESENEIRYVDLYQTSSKIYTRKISGFYQSIRRYTGIPLLLGFILLPWIELAGRPAVLFDLPARKFHILTITFWPQDFMLLAWALIISAFALFTVTTLVGRVWCGFTCPQTVWTLMFISVEHFFEGDRNKRIKLDKSPWNFNKVWRKSAKHGTWLLIAFITGVTFIGYFTPIRELLLGLVPHRNDLGMLYFPAHPAAIFWTLFFTVMTYLNAGWMREQVCKYMCPYARFQSVMYDQDTLAVYYDKKRGEPRGPRKPGTGTKSHSVDGEQDSSMGDCIDCSWCVQVCPVDIDIRDGLQYECINCGLCVDACNSVMDKMSYPRGLVRFTSEDELQTGKTNFIRPRLFGYTAAVVAMVCVFSYTIYSREPIGVDVLRDRGSRMYRETAQQIQNVYTLKINNMDSQAHTYNIELQGGYDFQVKGYRAMEIEAGEVFTLPLRIAVDKKSFNVEKADLKIRVSAEDKPEINAVEETIFMGPGK